MPTRRPAVVFTCVLGLSVATLAAAPPARGDDRDLLRQGQSDPYVFILLDVSGSMNQSVPCTAEDVAAGDCEVVCPEGACLPRRVSDDPDSRLRVAKEAIYEIMEQTDGVRFGFGAFDQDELRVFRKHWWYRLEPAAEQPSGLIQLDSGRTYPEPGHETIFGETWACDEGRDDGGNQFADRVIGCTPATPADLSDPWDDERMRRWPKLDDDNDTARSYYVRDAGTTYRVTYSPLNNGAFAGQRPGDAEVTARVRVERCLDPTCAATSSLGEKNLAFEEAGAMVYWEPGEGISRSAPGVAFFGSLGGVRQSNMRGGNTGLELNSDSGEDGFANVNLKYDTVTDPFGRGAALSVGDLVPFDWRSDQRDLIRQRMAPNLILGQSTPDFGVAGYFEDHPRNGESILRLIDDRARPLFPRFGTPTGRSMEQFRIWFTDWLDAATDAGTGDPDLPCRSFNVVVVTDGLASDGVSACGHANQLRNFHFRGQPVPVRSFAVALGNPELRIPSFSNVLDCIADNGGSGETDHNGDGEPDGPGPLFPQNKDQLVEAFQQIFELISSRNRSFAAAAVPQAQANTEDKIFLTNFSPVPGEPIWAGRIDGYLRPIPLLERLVRQDDGTTVERLVPDRAEVCAAGDESACRLWDAGEELLEQAPDAAQIAARTFNLGNGEDQRRVYYARLRNLTTPEIRKTFEPPATDADWQDLLVATGTCDPADPDVALCAADPVRRAEAERIFDLVYTPRIFRDPETDEDRPYLLGDVFHSNPRVIGAPDTFQYFASDLFGNGRPCDDATDPNRGYRCFFDKHRFRRNVLLVGSNDGQLHAFDAGIFRGSASGGQVTGDFDNGTGREVFSIVPRPVLPALRDLADPNQPARHRFTVDGTPVTADVFIDPAFSILPDEDEREWRTVVVGGLREGGRGYYALDVTQPDDLGTANLPQPRGGATGFVPSCSDGGTGCGPLPYPAVLWEMTDSLDCAATVGAACDDDANGLPDLGDTWSTPNVGIIEVCEESPCDFGPSGNVVRKFVAVMGGGLDPERKDRAEQAGDFLYMIDVETGFVIYKRELEGGAPSAPAAVDTDRDGVLDTIYIGTTRGFLYKVDLSTPVPLTQIAGFHGPRVLDPAWEPFQVFDTGRRPIYFPPAVVFIASRGQFALAFGTGDREDLWEQSATDDGRFYLFVDDGLAAGDPNLPFDQADLVQVGVGDDPLDPSTDLLIDAPSTLDGWFLPLQDDERVITPAFALGGVTAFSTFRPAIDRRTLAGNEVVCANRGESRVFVLFTTNANPVLGNGERFRVVPDLVTEPFTEVGAIKNPVDGSGEPTADDVTEDLQRITEALKGMFPEDCRFANYTINIKALRSDTGIEFIAPVPVCIVQRNWKEF